MNATDVVGYAQDGAAYCVQCWGSEPEPEEGNGGPVFADQADDLTCDECRERLDGQEGDRECLHVFLDGACTYCDLPEPGEVSEDTEGGEPVRLTYGVLPTWEAFSEAFERQVPSRWYEIRHGSSGPEWRPGAGSYSARELYRECEKLCALDGPEWEDSCGDGPMSWCSDILGSLGFEWI